MNFNSLFKLAPHSFSNLYYYKINDKYTILVKQNNIGTHLSINDYTEFEFITFGYSSKQEGLLDSYLNLQDYKKIGIDLSAFLIKGLPHRYGNVPRGLVEDTILKLESAAGINVVIAKTVIEAANSIESICSECHGAGKLDFGFYQRACMSCYKG